MACCANSTPLSKQAKSQAPQHKEYRVNVTDKTNYRVAGEKTEKQNKQKKTSGLGRGGGKQWERLMRDSLPSPD